MLPRLAAALQTPTFLDANSHVSCQSQNFNLQVDHDETDEFQAQAPISVIYSPGPNNTIYSLGMRRNFRRGYVTDFARVEGLPGALASLSASPSRLQIL